MHNQPTKHEVDYLNKINYLARVCNMPLEASDIGIMDSMLEDLGYERLSKAIGKILATRKGHDRFPSIRDIREAAGEAQDTPQNDHGTATEVAERIWTAIGKFGWPNGEAAKEFLGEPAWSAVLLSGGWQDACNAHEDQKGIFIAQMRDLTLSLLRKQRAGVPLMSAPQLPGSNPVLEQAMRLAEGKGECETLPT